MMKFLKLSVALLCLTSLHVDAQSVWNGGTTDWFTGSNWTPAGVPTNGIDVQLPVSVTVNQPDIGASNARMRSLDFQGAGWTIDGSGGFVEINIDGGSPAYDINSVGSGMNVINGTVDFIQNFQVGEMFVGTGNTLVINGDVLKPGSRDLIFNGPGKYIVNGDASGVIAVNAGVDSLTPTGSYLINGPGSIQVGGQLREPVINSGNSFGGNVPTVRIYQYQVFTFESGSTLSPGGDGATFGVDGYDGGDLISTMTVESTSATIRAYVLLESGSTLAMDLGTGGVGDNDMLLFDLNQSSGGKFTIESGVTLDLFGSIVQDGTYTLLSDLEGSGNLFTGTFDTVNFNGVAANPSNFTVNYNINDITLTVSGVPEPTSFALLLGGVGGLLMFRRRR